MFTLPLLTLTVFAVDQPHHHAVDFCNMRRQVKRKQILIWLSQFAVMSVLHVECGEELFHAVAISLWFGILNIFLEHYPEALVKGGVVFAHFIYYVCCIYNSFFTKQYFE